MRLPLWLLLALLLSGELTPSVSKSAQGNPAEGTSVYGYGLQSRADHSRRTSINLQLRRRQKMEVTAIGSQLEFEADDEDRGIFPREITSFVTKLKAIFAKPAKSESDELAIKLDDMYRKGITPDDLTERFGTTKLQLQKEYRQHYKWRESWKFQRPYPMPKKASPETT